MQELRELAQKLLREKQVKAVLGYECSRRGVRPAFVTEADDCDRLMFDHRCVQNLAAYLSPRRSHVARLGRLAVVVKTCDARAVAGLPVRRWIEAGVSASGWAMTLYAPDAHSIGDVVFHSKQSG